MPCLLEIIIPPVVNFSIHSKNINLTFCNFDQEKKKTFLSFTSTLSLIVYMIKCFVMHIETECDIDSGDKNDTFNSLWFSYFTLNCFKSLAT